MELLILSIVFLLSGCTSLVQKGGAILDGEAFSEKPAVVYQSNKIASGIDIELKEFKGKNGEEFIEISSSEWRGISLKGYMPDSDGDFELKEAWILSSHSQGWNEFTLDLLGSAAFSPVEGVGGVLHLNQNIERVQISSGKIRLKSSRLTGNAALAPLRNRRERILALTDWMDDWQSKTHGKLNFVSQDEFENFWKPLLFPEMVPKAKRPPGYSDKNANWGRADSIKWNKTYTEYIFPEEFWELRNSGALLRDWEEALPWIYIEYSWDYMIDSFSETLLYKIE